MINDDFVIDDTIWTLPDNADIIWYDPEDWISIYGTVIEDEDDERLG